MRMGLNTFARRLTGVSTLALLIGDLTPMARAATPPTDADLDAIIVTGTRDVGVKAQDSPTPIAVLGAELLQSTGQNNVFDALKDVLPSFSASAMNEDMSSMVRSARLRGMSPGEVLVLINGKRRHASANVNADQDPDVSSNPADLDMIPMSMIDHVEVLEDGAAAQYGSDAVAGVVNIILKNGNSGTSAVAGAGITTRGDGSQATAGINQGLALGTDGFLNISLDYRFQDAFNRSGIDVESYSLSPAPVRNRLFGGPRFNLVTAGYNLQKPLGDDVEFYSFATFGWRDAVDFQNDRLGNIAPTVWPLGFFPKETLDELDGAFTAGIKGNNLLGWDWDLSTTWGEDHDRLGVGDTVNPGLANPPTYAASPGLGIGSPINVYAGNEINTQWTTNLDFRRPFEIGLSAPLNAAFGVEYRHETYSIGAGEPASYIDGGTSAYSGFAPVDASNTSRNVEAAYVDLSAKLLPNWLIDVAGRFENYDSPGVGGTENGKLTTRYDITPHFAVRGTVSDGFHAPTLAQSNFAATNISAGVGAGQNYFVQLPVGSPGAKLLGARPLVPETAKDVDVGFVAQPLDRMHVTLDAYQVILDHRIINTGTLSGPLVTQALALNGLAIEPGDAYWGQYFNNGVSTRTRGLDLSADYRTDFGPYGTVKWMLNGNYNEAKITHTEPVPPQILPVLLNGTGLNTYLSPQVVTDLTKGTPQNKVSLAANYIVHDFDITLRETRYGHVDENDGTTQVMPYTNIYIKSAYITDLDIGYFVNDFIKIDIGGNNIFDVMPAHETYAQLIGSRQSNIWPNYTPWGIQGAYFYSRVTATF